MNLFVVAQNHDDALARQLVTKNASAIGISQDALNSAFVSNSYFNQVSGTQLVYLQQGYKGLPVYNQLLVLAFKDGKLISKAGEFLSGMESKVNTGSASPSVAAEAAVRTAIADAKLAAPSFVIPLKTLENGRKYDFGKLNGLATENVTAELMWVPVRGTAITQQPQDIAGTQQPDKIAPRNTANAVSSDPASEIVSVKLAWQVQLFPKANADMWNVRVDAGTNSVIDKNNLTVYEALADNHNMGMRSTASQLPYHIPMLAKGNKIPSTPTGTHMWEGPTLVNTVNYTVIPYPAESPIHPGGTAAIRTNPWTLAGGNAVTLGWHNDGASDYTYSRGNNVYAQEDRDNNNNTFGTPANSTTTPDPLNFTYPINYNLAPTTTDFQQFAITNLFYWNNILHDITYNYGFTEPAGNFQNDNLGRGGAQNDYVIADAQDAGGTNNANMGTPADGGRPRMQMYLWDPAHGVLTMVVNTPASIAGPYNAVEGAFSPANLLANVGPVTAQVVYYNDDVAGTTHDGCAGLAANNITGKIALINRGNCNFTVKVKNAQLSGAVAVIMVNNVTGPPIVMGGGPDATITIPAVMISDVDGATIAAQLANNVNVTLSSTPAGTVMLDGDIDNGIVCHEFFHGVSGRLTGGPANPNCLNNAEEGGEGWSDYNALMLTTNWATALPTDGANKPRTMGTYAFGQTVNGAGIRLYPYCTNISVNPLTYASMGVAPVGTEVHNIGEIWCMAVWEMTWSIIQTDGINANLFNASGAGGNTVAYKLVMEGLKLQPCSPGYIDARNAILQADQNLYGGAHYCQIWAAFAKRGMGANASQGSSFSATDQVADFTVPSGATITSQPSNVTACNGTSASFTVGVTVGGGTVTYQWEMSTTGAGGPFSNVPAAAPYTGTTTTTLNINPVTNAMNGYVYRLKITSTCGVTTSNNATLTVIAAAVGGTVSPASATVCTIPNSNTFTLTGNIGPVVRWESSTTGAGGPFTTPIANTTNTLTVTNVAVTTWYRAVIQGSGCAAANSSVSVVTVLPGAATLFIDADPNTPLCAGDPTKLTAMEGAGPAPVTVSQSSNNTTIVAGNSVACPTPPTSIWRAYTLSAFPAVTGNFTITTVKFGIEAAIPATQNITVNIYNQTGAAFPGGTRTLIGSQVYAVPTQNNTIYTATLTTPITVPNTATIILEVASTVANGFFIGSNTAAETAPTYISAAGCGLANPGTVASVGFPNMHAILYMTGTVPGTGGIVTGGTFLWSPAAGLSSTTTNPVAASPATTTTYTVTHNNGAGCVRTASITVTVNQRPAITTQPSNVTVCNGTTATFTAAGSGTGLTYQWQLSTTGAGGPWSNVPAAAPYAGTTTTTLTINPVAASMNGYRYRLVVSGVCPVPANSNGALLSINALPAVTVTPAGPVCGGIPGVNGVMLTTGGGSLPPIPGSVTVNSGSISIPIPDPSPGMNPTTNVLNVAGIPANATITGVSVTWTLPHTYPADLVINLKAPNNNVLSLYKHNTQTDNGATSIPTAGFFNAVVNNTSAVQFKSVPTPYRYGVTAPAGPYAPDVLNGSTNPGYPAGSDPVGYVSNVTGFSGLYTTGGSANGAWTLAMADAGAGDAGTLQNWQIKIDYTTPNPAVPISYTWAPAAGLYTDPNATIPYVTGTQTPTVYAAPTVYTVYTVTALDNATGCTNTASVIVGATPPAPTVTPNPVTMCLGDAPVKLKSASAVPGSCSVSSGTISIPIPDNTANGVSSNLTVNCVPAGATITGISVTMSIPAHTYVGDIIANLKAPNGTILNLDKYMSGTATQAGTYPNSGFVNAIISSAGVNALGGATSTPITGTWKADLLNGAIPFTIQEIAGFASTATSWSQLYSVPNGTWTLALADGGPADIGTLTNWSIKIDYYVGVPTTPATWSPITGLYSNAAGTIPYVAGTQVDSVWAQPTPGGVYNYNVTVNSLPTPPVTVTTPMAGGNGNNMVLFNLQNTNGSTYTLKSVSSNAFTSGTVPTVNLYIHSGGPIAGNPGAITAANGWVLSGTAANVAVTANTLNLVLQNLNVAFPANANYGVALEFIGAIVPAYTNGTGTLQTYTNNGVNIITDGNVGWGGPVAPGPPANNPRNFNGSVSMTSNSLNCTSSPRVVTVTVNTPVSIPAGQPSANQTICTDKVATFTVTGVTGTSPTYQWQVSTNAGGTYTNITNGGVYSGATTTALTITAPPVSMSGYFYRVVVSGAAPCVAANSAARILTVNPLPTIVIAANPYTRLLPGMVTNLTSTISPVAAAAGGYTWLRNGTPVVGANTGSLSIGVDALGDYSLRVTDVNGCTNTSNIVSIKDSASGKCFIYPNPNSGQFQVRYYSVAGNTGLPRTLTVYDAKGDRVLSQSYTIGRPYDRMDVDLRKNGKGLYWVEVGDVNGNRLTMCRIVVQ